MFETELHGTTFARLLSALCFSERRKKMFLARVRKPNDGRRFVVTVKHFYARNIYAEIIYAR